MNNTNNFESFLEKRNDILDGQAYQLLRLLTCPEIEQTETLSEFLWDMAFIGPLLETAESLLQKAGFSTCYPYYGENEIPCIHTSLCQHPNCPFLTDSHMDFPKTSTKKRNGGQKE